MPKLTYTIDGQEHVVDVEDSCSIGRDPTNSIGLESEAGASRRHCQIIKLQKSYELADLGSTNGTKVNGKTVKRHRMAHGDSIEIGSTTLRFTTEEGGGDGVDLEGFEEEISLEEPGGGGGGAAAAPSGECYLAYAGGSKDGQKVALDQDRVTFGRKPSCTVPLDDSNVSGYHCEITREGGAYVLRDLGSTNGTLLDGEPVSEIALQHGGRIRVGSTRLVFLDPTVADFEKAMSAVDDLGSEWGLLRAEMDLSRVQKARRSQMVTIGALFVLLAGTGYVLVAHPELLREKKVLELETIEGNQIEDFSFEELASGWAVADGTPTEWSNEEGDAAQGSRYMSVTRDGSAGVPATVWFEDDAFTVSPGSVYEFGAQVRAADGGHGGVRVRWVGAEGVVTGYSSTGLRSGSEWGNAISKAVPPAETRSAHIELINAGDGAAHFDDVFFNSASGSAEAASATDGTLSLAAGHGGHISILRDSGPLLADAAVVGGLFDPDALATGRRPARAGSGSIGDVSNDGTGVKVTGKTLDPKSNELREYEVSVSLEGGRFVNINATLPEGAALTGILPTAVVREGLSVEIKGQRIIRISTTRMLDGVTRLLIGDRKQFAIKAVSGMARVVLVEGKNGYEFGLAGDGGPLSVQIDTDTGKIKERLQQVKGEADDDYRQKRHGKAIVLYGQLMSGVAEGHADYDLASKRIAQLEKNGKDALATLTALSADATRFNHDRELERTADQAEELATRYEGHSIGEGATALVAKIAGVRAERHTHIAEREAAPLLRRAQDFQNIGKKTLAAAFYRDVVARFEGTDAASKAQAALEKLK